MSKKTCRPYIYNRPKRIVIQRRGLEQYCLRQPAFKCTVSTSYIAQQVLVYCSVRVLLDRCIAGQVLVYCPVSVGVLLSRRIAQQMYCSAGVLCSRCIAQLVIERAKHDKMKFAAVAPSKRRGQKICSAPCLVLYVPCHIKNRESKTALRNNACVSARPGDGAFFSWWHATHKKNT